MTVGYDAEHSDLLAVYMIQSLYGLHSFFLAVKLIIIFELEIKGLFANKNLTLREYTYVRSLNMGFTNGFVSLLCYGQLQCGCGFR